MSFQPFGERFEISTPRPAAEVRDAIRARKKKWFDPKPGARGWVAGPFVYLWSSPYDSQGPALAGRISQDRSGTRVRGRAGANLHGVAVISLLIPITLFWVWRTIATGETKAFLPVLMTAAFLTVAGTLIYRHAHISRHDADPLVRFLQGAITPPRRSARDKLPDLRLLDALTLTIEGQMVVRPITVEAIRDALLRAEAGDGVILATAPETYIQSASRYGGYAIERRDGGHRHHFRATRRGSASNEARKSSEPFTFEEALAAFLAFASAAPMPSSLEWEPLGLSR